MKRKLIRTTILITVIFISAALAGCYFVPEGETGSITVDLGSAAGSRSLSEDADAARVYLLSDNGAVFDFGGGALYAEGTIGGEITVENVPAEKWNVLVTAGKTVDGIFIPTNYGETGMVEVTPGVNNPHTITMQPVPFDWAENLAGEALSGVVTFGTDIYASSSGLYSGTGMDNMSAFSFPAGYTINSISEGQWFGGTSELWVNTDKGIVPYRSGWVENFQSAADPAFGVWKSGSYYDAGAADVTVFFRSNNGFGGVNIPTAGTPVADYDWENYTDFDEALTGELIYDFFLQGDSTYFASALGAFRLSSDIVENPDGDFFAEADFFEVVQGEGDEAETLPVNGVGYLPVGLEDQIVMATDGGVFFANLDDLSGETLTVTGITETLGEAFSKVAVTGNAAEARAAAVTATRLYLLKFTAGPPVSIEVKSYGFHAGYPGGVEMLQWTDDNRLLIAGSGNGLATAGLVSLSGW